GLRACDGDPVLVVFPSLHDACG
ncbi:unnamed protein product, partial [Urochloa humidicola]